MKIRKGFVSNSSSSSFIVIFPKIPKNAEEVKEILFGDKKFYYSPFNNLKWNAKNVADTVWKDICEQKPNDLKIAKEQFINGTGFNDPSAPDYFDYEHITDLSKRHEEYERDLNYFANKKLNEIFNIRKLKLKKIDGEIVDEGVLYTFEYSDNRGDYFSALEHGDLFKNLKHIKISNH